MNSNTNPNFWFTADTHFGTDSNNILKREMRPFANTTQYADEQVKIWNQQVGKDDFVYVIGDFCNYNREEKDYMGGLAISRLLNGNIILLTGNSEERVIAEEFDGDFDKFRDMLINSATFNFHEVKKNEYTHICGQKFFLTHKPTDHDKQYPTLFGHFHRTGGLWRPYGLNVGVDLNHFKLYSSYDIMDLMEQKHRWWDDDPDNNCFD